VGDNTPHRVAFDSVVVIDCLQKTDGRYEWISPIVTDAENGLIVVIVSTMAISETVGIVGYTNDQSRNIIHDFYRKKWVFPITPGILISELSQEIQRSHRVDCADAVHLATALFEKTPIFLTNDGDSKKKKKRKKRPLLPLNGLISYEGTTLRIMTPKDYYTYRRSIGIFENTEKHPEGKQI
jgi:predicted nucleic acid-binding protein